MTTKEIMARINKHLKRMENDKTINAPQTHGTSKLRPYYMTSAGMNGRWPFVQYVSYQGPVTIKKEEAEAYLAWLDAGNNGTHWNAERSKTP
jgi:hypothetical protein